MPTEAKHSGAWRSLAGVEAKHSGAWRSIKKVYAKHSGAWREVFSALSAAFNTTGDLNLNNGNCYAGLRVDNNGLHYHYSKTAALESLGTWLESGTNSEVWVECVIFSGSWNNLDAGTSTRLVCSTDRIWRILSTSGSVSVTCNFKFWDASSGGNLLDETGNITFSAEDISGGF